jgi:hypothetical protein
MSAPGFVARVVTWEGNVHVNICDEELLGTKVQDGTLEMHISRDYFGGEMVGSDEAIQLVRSCAVANLVGGRIVQRVLAEKLAAPGAVRTIGNVAFLMIFKFTSS